MTRPALSRRPLIAILRGLRPEQAIDVGEALYEAGFRAIEVPLNSPEPFDSIARLVRHFGDRVLIGAGTVTSADACRRLAEVGARLAVAPNTDTTVIAAMRAAGMIAIPGVATPSEAFSALKAGADALKLFPADAVGTAGLRAWRSVLPPQTSLVAVGGVDTGNMGQWQAAGIDGFGIGAALLRPDMTIADIRHQAGSFFAAFSGLTDRETR